jgi:dUTP pyrophosphatase
VPVSSGPAASAVEVLLLRLDTGLEPPAYAHPGDAGADLRCTEDFVLAPGERRLVGTGVAVALPEGYAAFVHPRSGLAARHGITLVNAPGTVDAGYRGEIKVCLLNTDPKQAVAFSRGDRIAQLVVQPVSTARFVPVAELPTSVRGGGGHGSTGGILGTSSQQSGASMTIAGGIA